MGWPKVIIVPSEVIGKHMVNHFGVSAENIRIIPRSVDLKKFDIPREDMPGKSNFVIDHAAAIPKVMLIGTTIAAVSKVNLIAARASGSRMAAK